MDRTDTQERLARIEQMIEEHRRAKKRQLLRRAIKLYRRADAAQKLARLDAQPQRVH
jgi:hypothetical protein